MNAIKNAIYSEFTTSHANAKFMLVGHSQGGLVNMEVEIAQPDDEPETRLIRFSFHYGNILWDEF